MDKQPNMPSNAIRESKKATVFYDGSCPMCSREIKHYRRLKGSESIQWIDAATNVHELEKHGLTRDQAMARFHVLDAKQQWQTGAYGFIELWSHLPAYRWLSNTVSTLKAAPLLDKAYTRFASWRMRRQCKSGQCQIPSNKP